MIRTTNKPSTTCFRSCGLRRQPNSDPGLTALHPALTRRAFSIATLITVLTMETALAAPAAIETEFADNAVLITLPATAASPADRPDARGPARDAEAAANQLQTYLTLSRTAGDPRYLGYAQALVDQWPKAQMTDRLLILHATLNQSLHRFEAARLQLRQVISRSADPASIIQARVTLANLELVQGHYAAAGDQCDQLAQAFPGLIADSCQALVQARTGHPRAAYDDLLTRTQRSPASSTSSLAWAEGTLADLAAQLGKPAAGEHWRRTLVLSPDDLYTRIQLADWLLAQGDNEAVMEVTEGFAQTDALMILRAIAMKQLGHPGTDQLTEHLKERFREAQWRGNLLHQRDFARFALDVEGDAETALTHAQSNWQQQREPLDTRLLLRAARAANATSIADDVKAWLARHNQTDARYPEDPS